MTSMNEPDIKHYITPSWNIYKQNITACVSVEKPQLLSAKTALTYLSLGVAVLYRCPSLTAPPNTVACPAYYNTGLLKAIA